ncbi:MAG: hypothetical protein U0359_22250 [Byssovorax sp.]
MARSHLLVLVPVTLLAALTLAPGCHKREVCGGRGMVVDTRPLSGVLAEVGMPPGATICKGSTDDGKYADTHRLVEIGKNGNEGADAWRKHMESKGWKDTTPLGVIAQNTEVEAAAIGGKPKASCMVKHEFSKEGGPGKIQVEVSFCADVWKEVGWTNVSFLKK